LNTNLNDIDDLIGKYLAGEAGADEAAWVESWAKADERNQRYFDQLKTIFQKAGEVKEYQTFDTDAAWNKLKHAMRDQGNGKVVPMHDHRRGTLAVFWRVAASVVLLATVGFFAYKLVTPQVTQPVVVATERATAADTLPDGSDVFLNRETQITYAYNKKEKTHTVKLKGEAYFNIHHEDDKKFVVQIGDIFIRDIGTAFNVKAYPDNEIVEVVVSQGEVMFYTNTDSGVYLRANGKGIYNRKTKKFTIDQPEANVLSYKTKLFIFDNTDLATVAAALNNVYERKIVVSENLKQCRLNVTFNNEQLDAIVDVIAETYNLKVREMGGQIILEGPGCATP